ncbi:MAG TPA: GTPase domain-containing protein [Herpetosiphonaceae bacterium]
MPTMDFATDTIYYKLVYYGEAFGGKLTRLRYLESILPGSGPLRLECGPDDDGMMIYCDYRLPLPARADGFEEIFRVQSIHRGNFYERTRTGMLDGADGIVFVGDSQRDKLEQNIKRLQELARGLAVRQRKISRIPFVLHYTKRDDPNALPVPIMDKYLNPLGWPVFESGLGKSPDDLLPGSIEAFTAICRLVASRVG